MTGMAALLIEKHVHMVVSHMRHLRDYDDNTQYYIVHKLRFIKQNLDAATRLIHDNSQNAFNLSWVVLHPREDD